MNKVSLIGHLCQDAEQKTKSDGQPYLKLRIAVNQRIKGQDSTIFVTAFHSSKAGGLAQYLTKGRQVYVDGTFTLATYQDRSGNTIPTMTVNAFAIELLGGRDAQQAQNGSTQQNTPRQNNTPSDDYLPF